ncbi:MAG TPA: PEP-CTERM sorting domain-containing protein [Phycisphaerae bacterium]|nr:PEP-CTERM sorting domain-containing protein [Phycisphaerae bacterium]
MRKIAAAALVLLALGAYAWADSKVLDGVPTYQAVFGQGAAYSLPATGPGDFGVATITPDALWPVYGVNPLAGVPEYVWWYGCSPTAGGMMVGYWDGMPGRGNLYPGDAGAWGGSGASGTKSMVASTAHIVAGAENGYTYGDWHNSVYYPNHESNPNCLADFMKTVDGGSYAVNITAGLETYCEWDNPATPSNESLPATAIDNDVPYGGGPFSYAMFKAEIDAGRPVQLGATCAETMDDWVGHSIVGYGYQDDMFQIKVPIGVDDALDLTVGGFAVMDTWANGTGSSEWVDWDWNVVPSVIDVSGVEWWPFVEIQGASWVYDDGTLGPYDWMITHGITLDVVPEPATLALMALGVAGALGLRRRRR